MLFSCLPCWFRKTSPSIWRLLWEPHVPFLPTQGDAQPRSPLPPIRALVQGAKRLGGDKRTELFQIFSFPQRGDTQAITTGEAGAVLKSPPTTWSSGHYSQWAFPQPNTSCFRTATPLAVRQPSRTTEHTPARPSMNALLPEFQLVGPDIYEQKVSQLLLLWLLLAWALCLFAITLR